ncbi:MAG: POTRA domain-containing protein [bacterium]
MMQKGKMRKMVRIIIWGWMLFSFLKSNYISAENQNMLQLDSITIEGNSIYTASEIKKIMMTKEGERFHEEIFLQDLQQIKELYHNQGYIYAEVKNFKIDDTKKLLLSITEGKIKELIIHGNKKTKEKIIKQEIRLKEGDVFNIKNCEQDLQRLKNLQLFNSVDYEVEYDDDRLKLAFIVEESWTILPWIDFGSDGRSYWEIGITWGNFMGNNQSIDLSYGQVESFSCYEIEFFDPRVFGSNYSIKLGLSSERILDEEHKEGKVMSLYERTTQSKNIEIGKKIEEYWELLFGFKTAEESFVLEKNSPYPTPIPKNGKTNLLTIGAKYDKMNFDDEILDGYLYYLSLGISDKNVGSDFNFTKIRFNYTQFSKLKERKNLGCRVMGGIGRGKYGRNLEMQHRFELNDFIRGYPAYEFKGDKMVVFNTEYRYPLLNSDMAMIQGVNFIDIGNVWSDKFGHLKMGIGIGIRGIFKPIPEAVIRLDSVYGLNSSEGPKLYLGLGQFF